MDKILEALVISSHPAPVKRAIVKKVVEAAEKEVSEEQCQALFTLTTRFILQRDDAFQKQVGLQVLEAYARYHRSQFERFFNKEFLLGLLQQGYGGLDAKDPAIVDYVHCCLRLLISCPSVLEICNVVQVEVLRIVSERPDTALCARISTLLTDFVQCIPRDKAAVLFCQHLVRTISYLQCSSTRVHQVREYVTQVTKVSSMLQNIWKTEPATLMPSLQEVFIVISSTDPSFEPSISLASLVQHIPLQMITVLIRSLTTDQNVKDASMVRALCRMIDWLSWPLAQYVETWIIALLRGLAAVQKFTILIDVTLLKIELVFNRLWYPIVREGALAVLSHMLLSFQHSPEAFHLVVPHVVSLVQLLKSDGLTNSKAFLEQFTELIHCMMYQYSGFPDLYENILEAIKELPKPSEEKIKLVLNQSAWTSQTNCVAPGLLSLSVKSETGKTGLLNLGNTCYMNSIIQTLFMATDFRREVLSLRLAGSNVLMKKLQLLFAFLAHTQRAAYAPRSFLEASRPPWFTAGSQQDCSEYLRFLLDRLHEEERAIKVFSQTPELMSADHRDTQEDVCGERTLVEQMFGGRLSTAIRCLRCDGVSQQEEPFTDLSLAFCPPVPGGGAEVGRGPVNGGGAESSDGTCRSPQVAEKPCGEALLSVPDLVDYFLAPEILDEDNKYYCESCSSLQKAEKSIWLVDAPKYLILTLLRFSYDAQSHVRRKILDNVSIPLLMQLPVHSSMDTSPKLDNSSSSASSPLQVDSPDSGENLAKKLKPSEGVESGAGLNPIPYTLCSVVMHSGMSSESGHYYCYGRNISRYDAGAEQACSCSPIGQQQEQAPPTAPDWFLFNDSRVTFTSFQSVQNVTTRFPKDTAYVLVYRKLESTQGNGPGLGVEPPLQKELMDAITKDNKLFLQEQELNARTRALQAATASCSFRPNGFDDNDPPSSCGPSGGGGGGFSTVSRLVF